MLCRITYASTWYRSPRKESGEVARKWELVATAYGQRRISPPFAYVMYGQRTRCRFLAVTSIPVTPLDPSEKKGIMVGVEAAVGDTRFALRA